MAQQIVAIDLSTRTTKAVWLRQDGAGLVLANYCFLEAPFTLPDSSRVAITKHLTEVRRALGAKTKDVILALGAQVSSLRTIEGPPAPRDELRRMVQLNAKHFFHEDISGHAFDCLPAQAREAADKVPTIIVGSAKNELLDNLQGGAKRAGFNVIRITPDQIGLANAASLAMTALIHKDALVLLHIGAEISSISFLVHGTLAFTRTIQVGTNELSARMAEAHKLHPSIPEDLKPSIVQSNLQNVLTPLAREVRAAIDYFESSAGQRVRDGFVAGDLLGSGTLVETLQVLEVPCRALDPKPFLRVQVPPEKMATIDKDLAPLAVAIGAAAGCLTPSCIEINLLAEKAEIASALRRDPVRWAAGIGAAWALVLLLGTGVLKLQNMRLDTRVSKVQAELKTIEKSAGEATDLSKRAGRVEGVLTALDPHATNRFLWALPLNALQQVAVDDIQVVGLKIEQALIQADAIKSTTKGAAKPALTKEQISLTIMAKNFADTETEEAFVEKLAGLPYFKSNLRKKDPVMLKNRVPRQADPLDASNTFTLFTIECVYPERVLGHD